MTLAKKKLISGKVRVLLYDGKDYVHSLWLKSRSFDFTGEFAHFGNLGGKDSGTRKGNVAKELVARLPKLFAADCHLSSSEAKTRATRLVASCRDLVQNLAALKSQVAKDALAMSKTHTLPKEIRTALDSLVKEWKQNFEEWRRNA